MEQTQRETVRRILQQRFGRDNVMALATTADGAPQVRCVNAFYQDGAFYIITHAQSGKMRQIARDPRAALCGEWVTAHGTAENLGYFGRPENADIAAALRRAFAAWIDNGHNDFSDENTCILRVRLTDGVLFHAGQRYEMDFTRG